MQLRRVTHMKEQQTKNDELVFISDAYHAPSLLLASPSFTPKSKPTFIGQDGHCSSISLDSGLTSHHPNEEQLR